MLFSVRTDARAYLGGMTNYHIGPHGITSYQNWLNCPASGKVFRIGTVRYNWPMSAHASQAFSIAHCTDSEDLPASAPATHQSMWAERKGCSALQPISVSPAPRPRSALRSIVFFCNSRSLLGVNRITYWSQGVASLPHKCQPPSPPLDNIRLWWLSGG